MRDKVLLVFIVCTLFYGCTYSNKVQTLSTEELCQNIGKYTLYSHEDGLALTNKALAEREFDKERCEKTAKAEYERLSPKYKLKLCQNLAAYHYKGAYKHFKNTLTKIEQAGFADQECNTMADFYYIRLSRKQEKAQAISAALTQAAENMRKSNEALYGPGTAFNPIHINVKVQ